MKALETLVEELKAEGIQVLDEIETFEYGKFVHILNPEQNKIELWEPVDQAFTQIHKEKPINNVQAFW